MEEKEFDLDTLFFDGCSSFSEYLEKKQQETIEDMKKIEALDKNSANFHHELMRIIRQFLIIGCNGYPKSLEPIEFLKKYDSYLTDDEVVEAYFSLNEYDLALEYINFNYDRIKRGLRNGFVAFGSVDEEGDFGIPNEYEYTFAINSLYGIDANVNQIHILPLSYNERSLNYLLYKYFFDDVSFVFMRPLPSAKSNKLYGFCHSLSWDYLKKIILDYYNKEDYETYNEIVKKYVSLSIPIEKLMEITSPPFNDIEFLYTAYEENLSFESEVFSSLDISFSKKMKEYEKRVRESVEPSVISTQKIVSNKFYANLNYLKTLPKKERITTEIFYNSFSLFYNYFQKKYNFAPPEYEYMFKRIFNRIIEGESLIDIILFENIESIYNYFKTGEKVNLNTKIISLDDIKRTNTKQYREIRNLTYNANKVILFLDEHQVSEDAIRILNFYGYDLAKRLLKSKISKEDVASIAKHKFTSDVAKDTFLTTIVNEMMNIKKKVDDINKVLRIFDYLFEHSYKNITLEKIIKRINSFEYILLPNNYNIKDNLASLDRVSKGEPLYEKLNGITLYNEYRFRTASSIPDIKGVFKGLNYETVDMHDPEIISNGIGNYLHSNGGVASSCLTPAGKASSCMKHGALSPHGRFFKVTINGHILAYSWIWRAGNTLCFDNIEVTDEINKNNIDENTIINLYLQASNEFINITKLCESTPLEVILIGKNKFDVIQRPFANFKKTEKQIKPNQTKDLYLKDSEEGEFILIGNEDNINTTEVLPIYKYKRKEVQEFSSLNPDSLLEKINSIYFDYCICRNEKYIPKKNKYKRGYIGEDWFVGYLSDGTEEFYYRNNNSDMKNEANKYLKRNLNIEFVPLVIKGNYDDLNYYLNFSNYEYDENEVWEYLDNIKEYLKEITNRDYFHTPNILENLGRILVDDAITSSFYGKHLGGNGSNGVHFVCVAEMNSDLYHSFSNKEGFIIDENICTFDTGIDTKFDFTNSRYPIRNSGGDGEKQTLDYIPLSKVKAIRALKNTKSIGVITYLEELTKKDIPIIFGDQHNLVDKNEIKRLIKLK